MRVLWWCHTVIRMVWDPFLSMAGWGWGVGRESWPSYSSCFYRWVNHPCGSGEWGSPAAQTGMYQSDLSLWGLRVKRKEEVYFPLERKKNHGLRNPFKAFHCEKSWRDHCTTTIKSFKKIWFVTNKRKWNGNLKPPLSQRLFADHGCKREQAIPTSGGTKVITSASLDSYNNRFCLP